MKKKLPGAPDLPPHSAIVHGCQADPGGMGIDNSLITISTESGDGHHNDTRRELSGVFHAITSANQRFKTC